MLIRRRTWLSTALACIAQEAAYKIWPGRTLRIPASKSLLVLSLLFTSFSSLAQTAEILTDTYGVPHIYAAKPEGALRAYGYSQMQAHADLLLKMYGVARGRGAEYFGPDFLPLDRTTRTLGIPQIGARWYQQQSSHFRSLLDAYANGINAYATAHRTQIGTAEQSVLPVRGADVMAHVARALLQIGIGNSECTLLPGLQIANPAGGGLPGSNAWALGSQRTRSGRAMLLANLHLGWTNGLEKLFEAQIVAPGINFSGATLVGFPVPLVGFDDQHGFTLSVNMADICDLYLLVERGDGFVLDGRARPYRTTFEIIKIKQGNGALQRELLRIRSSDHGPVFQLQQQAVAVRINGFTVNSIAGVLDQFWNMVKAQDVRAFQRELNRNQLPNLTVTYADRDRQTLQANTAVIPRRDGGDFAFWSRPLPGDRRDLIWTQTHSFSELPRTLSPQSGYLQSSNGPPWFMTTPNLNPQAFPAYFAPTDLSVSISFAREQRGVKLIQQFSPFTLDGLRVAKFDTKVESADRILPDLIAAANASTSDTLVSAAHILQNWDRRSDSESQGTALFANFYAEWVKRTTDQCLRVPSSCNTPPEFVSFSDFFGSSDFFANPWTRQQGLDTPNGLAHPDLALAALDTAAQGLTAIGVPLDLEWGLALRFRRGSFDFPGWGLGDPTGVFPAIGFSIEQDGLLTANFGESYIATVEFGEQANAKVLLTYGNSSRSDSPHYGDQLELLTKKVLREPWRSRNEVVRNLETITKLD